jgi:hypothetical protein
MVLLPEIDCFPSVTSFGDNEHVRLAPNQRHQTFAHNAVIIRDQDRDTRFLRRCLNLSVGFLF